MTDSDMIKQKQTQEELNEFCIYGTTFDAREYRAPLGKSIPDSIKVYEDEAAATVKFRCDTCGHKWAKSYRDITAEDYSPECQVCVEGWVKELLAAETERLRSAVESVTIIVGAIDYECGNEC